MDRNFKRFFAILMVTSMLLSGCTSAEPEPVMGCTDERASNFDAAAEEDDGEPFAEKMARLTGQLKTQFEESDRLEAEIKKNLAGLGYDV